MDRFFLVQLAKAELSILLIVLWEIRLLEFCCREAEDMSFWEVEGELV